MIVTAMVSLSFGGYARGCSYPTMRVRDGRRFRSRRGRRHGPGEPHRCRRCGQVAVTHRRRTPRGVRGVHRGDAQGRRLQHARGEYLPLVEQDHLGSGADLLRLSRLRGHRQHRRVDAESRTKRAPRHLPGVAHHRHPLRVDVDRRVRLADRGRGRQLWRDGTRRSRTALTRRRRLHDDVDRRPARHIVVGQRQLIRCAEPHRQPR